MAVKKIHYSVGEVAKILDVSDSNVRYWEKQFPTISPRVGGRNVRYYSEQDIEEMKLVKYLVKDQKYSIEGAQKKLRENKKDIIDKQQMTERLTNVKNALLEIKEQL
ncbi:MAG: MerR family transcriptional regulator [Mangrovibacterium sp.]